MKSQAWFQLVITLSVQHLSATKALFDWAKHNLKKEKEINVLNLYDIPKQCHI